MYFPSDLHVISSSPEMLASSRWQCDPQSGSIDNKWLDSDWYIVWSVRRVVSAAEWGWWCHSYSLPLTLWRRRRRREGGSEEGEGSDKAPDYRHEMRHRETWEVSLPSDSCHCSFKGTLSPPKPGSSFQQPMAHHWELQAWLLLIILSPCAGQWEQQVGSLQKLSAHDLPMPAAHGDDAARRLH